jgi:tyrosyl-tRNA synthetase
MNLIEELQWRGMIHDIIPETEEHFNTGVRKAYVGFDPTGDSLHVGHLVSIMLLRHLVNHGHKGIALIGGATGMIGDPSGKSEERNLLEKSELRKNILAIEEQIFDLTPESVEVTNNHIWFKDMNFLDFIRDVGKHIPLSYMLNKTSVKKRLESESGISFTEFTYQLVQGYDFLHLNSVARCTVQIGGSDQWGNITTGTEMIRRIEGKEGFGFTCPLVTKADGTKFGKTESGAIWLDPKKTSPYKFYQFWLNTRDEDAEKYIKFFTMLSKEEIEDTINIHNQDRGQRFLQKTLANEVTAFVHNISTANLVRNASEILFSDNVIPKLNDIEESLFDDIFEGVDRVQVAKEEFENKDFVTVLVENNIFKSKREARDMIKGGGFYINKEKYIEIDTVLVGVELLRDKYILLQRGKKKYILMESV